MKKFFRCHDIRGQGRVSRTMDMSERAMSGRRSMIQAQIAAAMQCGLNTNDS